MKRIYEVMDWTYKRAVRGFVKLERPILLP